MTWQKFWTLFHARWGSDHESPEYAKDEWRKMQLFLERKEREEFEP